VVCGPQISGKTQRTMLKHTAVALTFGALIFLTGCSSQDPDQIIDPPKAKVTVAMEWAFADPQDVVSFTQMAGGGGSFTDDALKFAHDMEAGAHALPISPGTRIHLKTRRFKKRLFLLRMQGVRSSTGTESY
jgi:hypothetical protein